MDLHLQNLKALRVLGRGAMGTVFLVTNQPSSDHHLSPPFALKLVEKSSSSSSTTTTVKPDSDRRALWEATVLSRLSHPFLPSLLGRLETPEFFAWAVPYCSGGDLNALRYSHPDHVFSPAAIRFYVSEIVTAIAHLHRLGIVYRDLKPENVLIQQSGHITLTDFDLSRYLSPSSPSPPPPAAPPILDIPKRRRRRRNLTRLFFPTTSHNSDDRKHQLKKAKSARVSPVSRRRTSMGGGGGSGGLWCGERSNSFVGTEEYVSPEVVRGDGHDFAVDWWALGILIYEMAYGRTPFRGRNRKETFQNVMFRSPEFVGKQSPELTDLIRHLLAKDPAQRLGSHGGAEEVKAHPFFRGVQWELLPEVSRPPYLAPCDDDGGDVTVTGDARDGVGFDIREYFEKQKQGLRGTVAELGSPLPSSVSLTEF